MKTTLQIEGLDQLDKALGQLSARVGGRLIREALLEAAEPMRIRARAMAPRAPGAPDMADHIEAVIVRGGVDGAPTVAIGPTRHFFYATFQEWGTSRHGAQPFMRPAFDSEARNAISIVSAALWRELSGRGFSMSASSASAPSSGGRLL